LVIDDYDKEFLLRSHEIDDCNDSEENSTIECEKRTDGNCRLFKKLCVNKKRVTKLVKNVQSVFGFTETQVQISTNKGIYTIIKSGITEVIVKREQIIKVPVFYRIFLNDTKYFIIFNIGESQIAKYFESQLINMFSELTMFILMNGTNPETKFILGGHSMGCALALHLSSILFNNFDSKFYNKIYVIGSGSPPCLLERENSVPNTFIFYSSVNNSADCIINENVNDFKLHYPFFVIDYLTKLITKIDEPKSFEINHINILQPSENKQFCNEIHFFSFYMNCFCT